MTHYLWLIPLGFIVGVLGTLIGAGGGFVLAPVLLLAYPQDTAATLTSISLAVVFMNALSGSMAYGRMKRIDYKSGLLFSAASVPGAVLGALSAHNIPRRAFDAIFGAFMIGAGAFMMARPRAKPEAQASQTHRQLARRIVERNGAVHAYSYNPGLGLLLSLGVGYMSSFLGIGGGIIHVPALARALNFPVHIATATSHFMLAIMALTGTIVHIATGSFHHGVRRTVALAIGVLLGAPLGARFSEFVGGDWIIRILAVALAVVGIRILVAAL